MEQSRLITIEVAFATPSKQIIVKLKISTDTSVIDAIYLSKIATYFTTTFPVLNESLPVGIFGKKIDIQTYKLQEHDRIEIYRPLNKTPNQKRLERAKQS